MDEECPPYTPLAELLNLVRRMPTVTARSNERELHSYRAALELAIGSGFRFWKGDFTYANSFGALGADPEWAYGMAITEGNTSAAVSFEHWKDRRPLFGFAVQPPRDGSTRFAHMSGTQAKGRIYVGCRFRYYGHLVQVTSFREDGTANGLVVVKHKTTRKRVKITYEGLRLDRAAGEAWAAKT